MRWPSDAEINTTAQRAAAGDKDAAALLLDQCRHILSDASRRDVPDLPRDDLLQELRAALLVTALRAWVRGGCVGDFGALARVVCRRRWSTLITRFRRRAGLHLLMRHVDQHDHDQPADRRLQFTTTPLQEVIRREDVELAAGQVFDASEPRPGYSGHVRAIVPLLLLGLTHDEASTMAGITPTTIHGAMKRLRRRSTARRSTTTIIIAHRDGQEVGRWPTAKQASKATGVSAASISEAMSRRRPTKGFTFSRVRLVNPT
jgi:hypothetical protein